MSPPSPAPADHEDASPAAAPSQSESHAPPLSQWLQLMLAEIAAKREALEHARAEEARRSTERTSTS